jgi:hypothetical protein
MSPCVIRYVVQKGWARGIFIILSNRTARAVAARVAAPLNPHDPARNPSAWGDFSEAAGMFSRLGIMQYPIESQQRPGVVGYVKFINSGESTSFAPLDLVVNGTVPADIAL